MRALDKLFIDNSDSTGADAAIRAPACEALLGTF